MNLREGTRRLALLLGVLGALGGSFVGYMEWQDIQSQRTRHERFEQLATSDAVNHLSKDHQQKKGDPWEANVKSVMPGCCGIKEVVWDTDNVWNDASGIYSIETEDGQTLRPTPTPPAWEYLFAILLPVLGFIIPWGAVRAIGWVVAGFVPSTK
jgi:hypothetical protein